MFFHRKKIQKAFDSRILEPAIRSSICTGERVAGFRNRENGRFTEDRLLKCDRDLLEFMEEYGISETPKEFY